MWELVTGTTMQAVFSLLVLCILIAGGFWLVSSFRDRATEDNVKPEELLANFEEMHREGDISGTEFRTIKASMARRLGVPPQDNSESS
jgi:uncharacterized membrane protein